MTDNPVSAEQRVTDEMIHQFKLGFHGSTLSDAQVKRGLETVFASRGLFDSSVPMADGGDTPMTAAEEVLAWLLIEKIGVPDDVSYSPDQAQEIITRHLDRAKELDQISNMLVAILPEFEKGSSVYATVKACLHLLERRRDALSPIGVSASAEPVAWHPTTCGEPTCSTMQKQEIISRSSRNSPEKIHFSTTS